MKIQLKRSNVLQSGAAKEPTASQLEYGELAINYNNSDPAIFLKDSNNNIIRISGVGNIADDGLTNVPAGTTPPTNPTPESGNLWYNSDEGRLYIYYVDTNTSQWVDASPDSWDPTVMPVTTNPAAQTGTLDDRYVMENGDTMTGALLLDNAASASAPDLSFDGDANTGIYSPGADQVAIATGGNGRVFIDSSGNVGVGTSSPDTVLDVEGVPAATSGGILRIRDTQTTSSAGKGGIHFSSSPGIDYYIAKDYNPSNSPTVGLAFGNANSGAEFMRIDSSGKVGIGTSSPSDLLHVRVNASGDQSVLRLSNANATQGNTVGINFAPANDIVSVAIKAIAEDSHSAVAERDGALGFFTRLNGGSVTEKMRIDSSGNLGINTTGPAAKLDVNGNQTSNVVAMAALNVDCSAGNYFTKTINGNSTFTFSNVPSSRSFSFVLELTHTSGTVTWPSSVKFPLDTAPTLTAGKTHLFVFETNDGGTRFRGAALVDYVN